MGSGESAVAINNKIDIFARQAIRDLRRGSYQIIVDRTYNLNDFPKEICGSILSIVEETFPFESKNNIKWIVQQIVHTVCGARTGLNPNIQIYRAYHNVEIEGDQLKITFNCPSFVYGVGGEWLNHANLSKMKVRFVLGLKYKKDSTMTMPANTVKILEAKDGAGHTDKEKKTYSAAVGSVINKLK